MNASQRVLGLAAGIAGLALAGSVQAATVIGATRIEIVGTILGDYAQLSEVEAFAFGSGDNVAAAAQGGSASATSSGFGSTPGNAIDGNDDPNSSTSFWVPAGGTLDEKFTVTFSGATTLSSLRIVGLGFCCQYRNLWDVTIFNAADTVLFAGRLDALNSPTHDASVTFDAPPATGAIPEPSTWAMMILGLGAAGTAIRSRRRVVFG